MPCGLPNYIMVCSIFAKLGHADASLEYHISNMNNAMIFPAKCSCIIIEFTSTECTSMLLFYPKLLLLMVRLKIQWKYHDVVNDITLACYRKCYIYESKHFMS